MAAVVIGASAGGPLALKILIAQLDADLHAAVVIVNHVGSEGPDMLADMLAHGARVPVVTARERTPVLPGVIHVAPRGYHLLIERDRRFALSIDEKVGFSRPSIDVLFRSAAEAYGPELAGVVLTGASADGAEGLRAIRQRGGLAFVQDPEEAETPTMPAAALKLAGADFCGSLAAIADCINKLDRP
ncbi:chemotaxis protein CheB [Aquabacter sp. CN5-332]|uniref:chemotaxis protein CheB n=1 Tax=Aquabacter sp. CN5-332 TaxID=3156608 RepID=UPI0032B5818D